MTKSVWKPRVALDNEMLARINTFYRAELDESLVGLDCFSHPSLGNHECNPEARLAGDTECRLCQHVFDRICPITCHLSRFCLMVFAYRLGIGGDTLDGALSHNGSMNYSDLNDIVKTRLKDIEKRGASAPILDNLQLSLPFCSLPSVKPEQSVCTEEVVEELAGVWLTLKEAAELYGCSYVNIHAHVKRGNLCAKVLGGVKKVKKDEVLDLMKRYGR